MFKPECVTLNKPEPVTRSRFTYNLTSNTDIEGEVIRHSNGEIDINYFADANSTLFAMFAADTDRAKFEARVVDIFTRYENVITRLKTTD